MKPSDVKSKEDVSLLAKIAHPLSWFKPGRKITVHDKMQDYEYVLTAHVGKTAIKALHPQKMLEAGIMGGRYLNDCVLEFPKEWFTSKALQHMDPTGPHVALNAYKVKASTSLGYWQKKGWIIPPDVRGWIQWYFRYFIGRRLPDVDKKQIARWQSMHRFIGMLKKHPGSAKIRQTLLHWAIIV